MLPKWFDFHMHARQGLVTPHLLAAHKAMGCYGILAMPNTQPPVGKVLASQLGSSYFSIEGYTHYLMEAGAGAFRHVIVPLYITRHTTPAMIVEGAKSGWLKAAKYYPPHGTTNSDHGIPMAELLKGDVLRALADNGVSLSIHGEMHGVRGEDWLGRHTNAELQFYREVMPRLVEENPDLKVVCEHITTVTAVDFVASAGSNVGASITPQHVLYVLGDLVQGMKHATYCMPVVKFEEDRHALRHVMRRGSRKFFAGTDSAWHPKGSKVSDCGCAAGCYVGGIAPQLYAQAFELAGGYLGNPADVEAFTRFLCTNGPDFYGIPRSTETFTLVREDNEVRPVVVDGVGEFVPLPVGMIPDGPDRKATLPWRIELN